MNNDNRFLTRADWRVLKSFIRNLVICVVFALCAWASQWFWQLLFDPASWMGTTITFCFQIIFALVAVCHAVAGVIVMTHYSIKDAVNQIWDRRN